MEYTYEDFLIEFVNLMKANLSKYGMEVSIVNKMRNNGILEKCIKVDIPGCNMSPSIGTLSLYEHYREFDDLVEMTQGLSEKIITDRNRKIDTMSVLSKENILNSTYLMVINAKSNQKLLSETPHYFIAEGELAVIPRLNINITDKSGFIIIKNGMLPVLQMTGEEILRVGKNNMVEQNLFEINSLLAETMHLMDEKGEDISDDFSEFFVENTPKTFVITNKDKKLGACCLVCPEVIETAINKLGIDCYILPSSIHEVILVEKRGGSEDLEYLRDCVKQVNRQSIPAAEILSDKVFVYNAKTKKIEIARTEQELQTMTQSAPHKSHGMHM
ncbi:MAG: hypothetical protein BHW40_11285 [Firmicutes bacterium CAG:65_45_313]|nr:MAG: hypothetical protein BHW40_11285 [Firmicutes bacterium CAG:65_45_313]